MIWGVRIDSAFLFLLIHANLNLSKWTVCGIFLSIIALAVAELGSAAPTSGGLYYWTFMFSSTRWRCLLSWIVGCKLFFHKDHQFPSTDFSSEKIQTPWATLLVLHLWTGDARCRLWLLLA